MMGTLSVSAVLVTYNRLELLSKSIQKVLSQDVDRLKHLIIIDGASTDGTREYLDNLSDSRLIIVHLSENIGGAGGFNLGIRTFFEQTNDDFVWLMDDDSMPTANALTNLLDMFDNNKLAGWGASKVVWTDGNWAKMNIPGLLNGNKRRIYQGDEKWLPIKHATFVSTIFKRDLIKKIGLPQKEYFIWGDDIEYTERAARAMSGYLVHQSIVIHASQFNSEPGDIVGEVDASRLPRYLFEYRNRLLTSRRRHSHLKLIKTLGHSVLDFLKTLFLPGVQYRGQKIRLIVKGTINGFKFNPDIEKL